MNPFLTQGGGSSATSTSGSRTGDFGPISFGNYGGLSFGAPSGSIDSRWLIGAAVALTVVALLIWRKK